MLDLFGIAKNLSPKHPLFSLEISGNAKCWGPSVFLFVCRKGIYYSKPRGVSVLVPWRASPVPLSARFRAVKFSYVAFSSSIHAFPRVIAEPRARPAPSISPSLVRKTLESRQVAPLPSSARSHALRATSACCRSNLSVPSRYALWCSLSECRASRYSPGHVLSEPLDPWPETPHTPKQSGSSRLSRGPLRINR